MSEESADTTYGRLLESVHISGYTMERACSGLEWLLEDDRWMSVGNGFERIDTFLDNIDLSQFKIAVDKRKKLSKRLEELEATQRATAKALGVNVATVNRDLKPVADATNQREPRTENNEPVADATRPNPLTASGEQAAKTVEKVVISAAKKELRQTEIGQERAELAERGAKVVGNEKWSVHCADMRTWTAPKRYDFIITDPPYPKEFLPLWSVLAERAAEWLVDGGLLIAMSGQSYLDQIYAALDEHLSYYWTAAYLTPGQPTPLRQVNVNTTWKPLLIYAKGKYTGKIFGDVFKSEGNDKEHHKWGQSESGMLDIVSKICLPGQSILDPFCGAGTTGVAAIRHGCFFDGIDIDETNVNISKARLG